MAGVGRPAGNGANVVIVGASIAGLRAVEELRRLGYADDITVVGEEDSLPYDRPPLSKGILAGTQEPDDVRLRRQGVDALEATWLLGRRATRLDVAGRRLVLDDATVLTYRGCVIATGAEPRRLPTPPELGGIFTLRSLEQALALRAELERSPRVVVVGAGFIGAEVAATCRQRGLEVTVLEALPAPMVRGLGPVLGAVLAGLHRDHGVDVRLGAGVAGFEGSSVPGNRRVERVRHDDGSAIECDVVVVGVGVVPATGWLEGSGLTLENGVVCDETLLAAPGVVAAGDVCRWRSASAGGELTRLEHWTNASEQGVAAAQRVLDSGPGIAFVSLPYVWSDQYDVKIQCLGRVRGDDTIEVVDGSLDERRFVALAGRDGRVVGAVGFNRPGVLMRCRSAIVEGRAFQDTVAALRAVS